MPPGLEGADTESPSVCSRATTSCFTFVRLSHPSSRMAKRQFSWSSFQRGGYSLALSSTADKRSPYSLALSSTADKLSPYRMAETLRSGSNLVPDQLPPRLCSHIYRKPRGKETAVPYTLVTQFET